jgi:hypothetical protein
MSDNEEKRRVKARLDHEMSQHYYRRSYKKTVSRKALPRADMTSEGAQSSHGEVESSDEDVEDEIYVPSPRAPSHGKGKELASGSGSGVTEIQEEEEEGEDESFDLEKINPPNSIHMGTPTFTQTQNPCWRANVNYKGRTEVVREKRTENPRLKQREATDYRFHTFFQ